MRRATHRTIAAGDGDIDRWSYNTAVAHCMELVNTVLALRRATAEPAHADVLDEAFDALLLVMAPMAPHVTAELWERRHPGADPLHAQSWPTFDPALAAEETVTMVVQVNGKVPGQAGGGALHRRGRGRRPGPGRPPRWPRPSPGPNRAGIVVRSRPAWSTWSSDAGPTAACGQAVREPGRGPSATARGRPGRARRS